MSSIQEFVCHECTLYWRDKYAFWNGYQSTCPQCGKSCEAVCDTQEYADQQEMMASYDRPLVDHRSLVDYEHEDHEKTEADLEAERDLIHDEIVEALGAVEADMSDIDDSEAGTDSEGADNGEGF
jgi:hypothetical protein